jgi:hypothetical protein
VSVPRPVAAVRFPDDVALVEAIVDGTLNSVEHFCGRRLFLPARVTVSWPERRKACVFEDRVFDDDRDGGTEVPANWTVRQVRRLVCARQADRDDLEPARTLTGRCPHASAGLTHGSRG